MDTNPNGINTIVRFNVTFSESVTGVTESDFNIETTGAISGASVLGVSGGGANWIVSVYTGGTAGGTIALDFIPQPIVVDADGNPIPAPFQGAVVYTIASEFDVTAPSDPVQPVNGTDAVGDGGALIEPGNANPANAIDDTTRPYKNGFELGSGLIVVPTRGAIRTYRPQDIYQRRRRHEQRQRPGQL